MKIKEYYDNFVNSGSIADVFNVSTPHVFVRCVDIFSPSLTAEQC